MESGRKARETSGIWLVISPGKEKKMSFLFAVTKRRFIGFPPLCYASQEKRELCVFGRVVKTKLRKRFLLLLCLLSRLGESKMPTVTTIATAWYILCTRSNNVATSTYVDPLADSSLGQIQTIGRLNRQQPRAFGRPSTFTQYTKFLQIWKVSLQTWQRMD